MHHIGSISVGLEQLAHYLIAQTRKPLSAEVYGKEEENGNA